jgi:hypothetical protein
MWHMSDVPDRGDPTIKIGYSEGFICPTLFVSQLKIDAGRYRLSLVLAANVRPVRDLADARSISLATEW